MNTKCKGSNAAARLKDVIRVSALLSSGSKTSGQPPTIHPPWNKARVGPLEKGEGSKDGLEEGKVERIGRGLDRGEGGTRENKGQGRDDEATERGRERAGGGEVGTWGTATAGRVTNNEMRITVKRGEGIGPGHRGELPGLSSTGHFASLDGGLIIGGSYFQTSVEASRPAPVKQKLSQALSLISLARRVQGPARVGDEQWSNGKSRDRGGLNSRKMYGSVGDMSVSASVFQRAIREERRKWEKQSEGEDGSSEGHWKREKRIRDSDSETGSSSKESPAEFSPSNASSPTSSVTAEHDRTESDTEAEKNGSNSGTEDVEGTSESESGSQSRTESEGGSGLESEDEGKELSRKPSKVSSSRSCSEGRSRSAKVKRGSSSSDSESLTYSSSAACSSRPQTSRLSHSLHETIEEESEEDKELGEEEAEGVGESSRQVATSNQSHIISGLMDASDDLSPIIEDTEEEEEEERSSCQGGDRDGDEEEGDLGKESD